MIINAQTVFMGLNISNLHTYVMSGLCQLVRYFNVFIFAAVSNVTYSVNCKFFRNLPYEKCLKNLEEKVFSYFAFSCVRLCDLFFRLRSTNKLGSAFFLVAQLLYVCFVFFKNTPNKYVLLRGHWTANYNDSQRFVNTFYHWLA